MLCHVRRKDKEFTDNASKVKVLKSQKQINCMLVLAGQSAHCFPMAL